MKNKNIIILIISVVIVAIIALISVKIYHNNKELNVKLYYNTRKIDFETGYIYDEIKLTNEQQEKIIEFYKKTDTKTHQHVMLAFIGMIKLEFSDGNIIAIDDNGSSYGYLEKHNGTDLIIELSNGFKEYILSIVEENRKEKEDG